MWLGRPFFIASKAPLYSQPRLNKMNKILIVIGVLFITTVLPINTVEAATYMGALKRSANHVVSFVKNTDNTQAAEAEPVKTLEVKKDKKVAAKKTLVVMATAYSSTPDQTDDTPCITATGYDICNKTKNVIAVSRDLVRSLGYGTQVRFPEVFGDQVFHIEDTMNARFVQRIDFHFDSREEAKQFGFKKALLMEVI